MNGGFSAAPSPCVAEEGTSRRRLLAWMGAGGAALFASLLTRDEARAGHDGTNVFHVGVQNNNPPGAGTGLSGNSPGPTLGITHASQGQALAVEGTAFVGANVEGDALTVDNGHPGGDGISAHSSSNHAVEGVALGGADVTGVVGVSGEGADYGAGPGTGVRGSSGTGNGVEGITTGGGNGVEARCGVGGNSLVGLALLVRGKSAFSTVGSGFVPAGRNNIFVPNPAVTDESHITVTLAGDPGPRELKWVERRPGSGFVVHLSPASQRPRTPLTYLIVEPTGF